ncbi:MAG: ABC transporter ATP-binding protein/permease [Acidobacteriota bacterium]|nr:ABC transporter ATP-binding protein/permease [Acidobacteriota bacterium]
MNEATSITPQPLAATEKVARSPIGIERRSTSQRNDQSKTKTLANAQPERRSHRRELEVLWGFMRPQLPLTLQAVGCGALRVGTRLLPSLVALLIFDYVLTRQSLTLAGFTFSPSTLLVLAGGIVVFSLGLDMPLVYLQRLLSERAGQQTIYQMRRASFEKLQRLPASFFQVRSGGKMIMRFIGDMSAVLWLAGRGLVDSLIDAATLAVVLTVFFWLNPLLAAASLLGVPLFLYALRLETHPLREEARSVRKLRSALAGNLQEQFLNATTMRRLADRDKTLADFDGTNVNLRDGLIGLARRGGKLESFATVASTSMSAIILLFGAWLFMHGGGTTGVLAAFFFLSARVLPIFRRLARFNQRYTRALVGLERVVVLLDTEETASQATDVLQPTRTPLEIPEGLIEAREVSFQHTEKRGLVFENLSLQCLPGQLTAIIGAGGSGKSTLAGLLAGHLKPERGGVFVDGQNVSECEPMSLGHALMLIEEDAALFADSLFNNICYGWDWRAEGLNNSRRNQRIREAAQIVGLDGFIESLPKRLKTKAGQRGMRLSGQQRMGIALMRALVRRPALVVIDGAEEIVNQEMIERLRGLLNESDPAKRFLKGIVILGSDPLLGLAADRVAVIEGGRIVECDTVTALHEQADSAFQRLISWRLSRFATLPKLEEAPHSLFKPLNPF